MITYNAAIYVCAKGDYDTAVPLEHDDGHVIADEIKPNTAITVCREKGRSGRRADVAYGRARVRPNDAIELVAEHAGADVINYNADISWCSWAS